MNIAIITTSLNSGGAERIAGLLSKELSKVYNVYLFLLSVKDIVYEYGGTIVDIGHEGPFYEQLIRVYKEKYNIHVSISFLEIMNFANIRTQRNEKVIISERCVQSLIEPSLDAQRLKIQRYYDYADEIVTCSYGVKYDLAHNYGIHNTTTTIYNFINKENIIEKATSKLDAAVLSFLDGKEYFLNIGRLDPQKNQTRLINQFEVFHRENRNLKLLILGSGKLYRDLQKKIEEKQLDNYVQIIPYAMNPFKYIKHARALIVSSHYEGLPNVILEAMTVGCPVISTDCLSGPRELLADIIDYSKNIAPYIIARKGILISDELSEDTLDTQYMAMAMKKVATDDDLCHQFCDNQIEYMKLYSNETIVNQWISIIENPGKERGKILISSRERIDSQKKLFIYGSGLVGTKYFLNLKDDYHIDGFVVSKKNSDEVSYMDRPLYELDKFPFGSKETQFIIGVSDNTQDEIVRSLKERGYNNIIFPYLDI